MSDVSVPLSTTVPVRRPYTRSCHCGNTQYIVYLTLPPIVDTAAPRGSSVRIYKCNCSTCQKMGLFHVRPINPATDFVVLSPLAAHTEATKNDGYLGLGGLGALGEYRCNDGLTNWTFCKGCGVRCFSFTGEGEIGELGIDLLPLVNGTKQGETKEKTLAWRTKFVEGAHNYLTINGITLDQEQEGLDLREWAEKGWVQYLDCKDRIGKPRFGLPHEGGMY
jgi:hypothetical protein